jgi:hypothetical protein
MALSCPVHIFVLMKAIDNWYQVRTVGALGHAIATGAHCTNVKRYKP